MGLNKVIQFNSVSQSSCFNWSVSVLLILEFTNMLITLFFSFSDSSNLLLNLCIWSWVNLQWQTVGITSLIWVKSFKQPSLSIARFIPLFLKLFYIIFNLELKIIVIMFPLFFVWDYLLNPKSLLLFKLMLFVSILIR